MVLRITPGGKTEFFELPNVYGKSLRRLAGGRLLLGVRLPPPTPKDYHSVSAERIVELRSSGGKVRQLWEWSEYPTDGSVRVGAGEWLPFEVSPNGELWGVVDGVLAQRGGEPLYGRSGGYDITLGSTRKNAVWRGAKSARTTSLRFDEVDTLWNEEYWPGWAILDSEGPVIALSWRDEDFIAHCAEECSYTVPLFGQPEEWRSGKPGSNPTGSSGRPRRACCAPITSGTSACRGGPPPSPSGRLTGRTAGILIRSEASFGSCKENGATASSTCGGSRGPASRSITSPTGSRGPLRHLAPGSARTVGTQPSSRPVG